MTDRHLKIVAACAQAVGNGDPGIADVRKIARRIARGVPDVTLNEFARAIEWKCQMLRQEAEALGQLCENIRWHARADERAA